MKIELILLLSITGLAIAFSPHGLCGCPPINEPVCASDYKTYPNKCSMGCDGGPNLVILYYGRCYQSPPAPVVRPVNPYYWPSAPVVTPVHHYSPVAPIVTPSGPYY